MVLAPYTVQKRTLTSKWKRLARVFMINVGWVPKGSKHLVLDGAGYGAIQDNDYSENLADAREKGYKTGDGLERLSPEAENWFPVSSVTAYVRRGEEKDILRGYNNWPETHLYKFIDLPFMTKLFGIINHTEASVVYLDRIQAE